REATSVSLQNGSGQRIAVDEVDMKDLLDEGTVCSLLQTAAACSHRAPHRGSSIATDSVVGEVDQKVQTLFDGMCSYLSISLRGVMPFVPFVRSIPLP